MSLFNSGSVFTDLNASHFSPMAMCVYDAAVTGFRALKASDSIFTFQSGNNVSVASGSTIQIINTGIPNALVQVTNVVNVTGTITGTINAVVTNMVTANVTGVITGSVNAFITNSNALSAAITGTITGSVNAFVTNPLNSFNAPSNFAISGSGQMGTALASNAARKALFVQNIGTNPLFIKFGATGASDSSMSMILAGGTLSGDGKGGSFIDEGCQVTGLVAISGVQPNYIVWEA